MRSKRWVWLAAPLAILIAPVMGRSQQEQQPAGSQGSTAGAAVGQTADIRPKQNEPPYIDRM
jgi:hypothetical protein